MSFKQVLADSSKSDKEALHAFVTPVNTIVQEGDSDAVEEKLWSTWEELLEVAGETPHAEQDKLAQMIRKVQRLPGPDKDGEPVQVWDENVEWEKMSLFGPVLRERWNFSPEGQSSEAKKQWVNINAFVARVTADYKPSEPFDHSLLGLWSIRDALEEPSAEESVDSSLVQAASVWFIYAGQVLIEKCQSKFEYEGGLAKEGQSLAGKEWSGGNMDRWRHWEKRLQELSRKDLDQETKGLIEKALAEFKKVSGGS